MDYDKDFEDFVSYIFIHIIGIIRSAGRSIADDVIQVAKNIKVVKSLDVFKGILEKAPDDGLFILTVPQVRVVGIFFVYQVDRADDKVKVA